ncbi:MAG: PspA/IM30 family protein [Gemmatimonadota bacterium]
MFKRVKRMLDDVLDHLEGSGGVSDDDVDRLIAAMRDELVATKTRIPELEELLRSQLGQADRERAEAEACDRRARQAEEIGDAETVEVARRFEAQHRQRLEVLVMKAETTRAEILQHRDEVVQMTDQLKKAIARRDALGIQSRRAGAIGTRAARDDASDAFDRMAERVEGATDIDEARRELDRELDPLAEPAPSDYAAERMRREQDAEQMLRELKRRMGRED